MDQAVGCIERGSESVELVGRLDAIGVLELRSCRPKEGPQVLAAFGTGGLHECRDGLLGRGKGLAGIGSAGGDSAA